MRPGRSLVLALIREPLAHFLVIGAAIFALYGLIADRAPADAENRIEITAGDIDQLRATWKNKWQRPPTAEELRGLVETKIRETVLYREALAMGLESDDTIIKNRLAQKLEFLTEDIAAARKPTDAELAAFFAAHRDRYLVSERLSLSQIYFNPSKRAGAQDDAARVLALAHGIPDTNTARRLQVAASSTRLGSEDVRAIVDAFFFIQSLRLRNQYAGAPPGAANRINPYKLNELDRLILKEAFKQARKLQQRLRLEYQL